MQAGGQFGMQTMDASLADLVQKGVVPFEQAKERCHNVEEFARLSGSEQSAIGGQIRSVNVG
jgi:twitching motility protein PilT